MFIREREVKGRTDVNYHTARRLGDMTEPLSQLARTFDDGIEKSGQLMEDDGLAAMQTSAALMRKNYNRCNLYADSEKEDSYYLYYLLRAFEQKGHIDFEDILQMFQGGCRKKEDYLVQLNQSLGRATMNLSWKNRFLKSKDAVVSQFRGLSVILEELSHQIDRTRDITDKYECILKKRFRRYHVALRDLLLLEYENGQKEAFPTVRAANGRCIISKDTALIMEEVMDGTRWGPAKDSRSVITKRCETVRSPEEGDYRIFYGASRIPRKGEKYSGDNYTFYENLGNQVVMSLSDGMGSGEAAARESKQVMELTEQLLETGFSPKAALKLVNAVLLLTGPGQYPTTLNPSCISLHADVLEVMKLGAVPTFIIGEEGMEIMKAGEVPMGVLNEVEPVLMSRKSWEGGRIVMASNGVLDVLSGDGEKQAMQQYLESVEEMEPQELANQMSGSTASFISAPRGGMTVLAAGIWKGHS